MVIKASDKPVDKYQQKLEADRKVTMRFYELLKELSEDEIEEIRKLIEELGTI